MKNLLKNNPLTKDELNKWKLNPLINPRTSKAIQINGKLYKYIENEYNKYYQKELNEKELNEKELNEKELNEKELNEKELNNNKLNLIDCNEDRDPISMNLFWIEEGGIKKVVYPEENIKDLILYLDSKNIVRCFEKESLIYLKSYNIKIHPISMEIIPEEIINKVNIINLLDVNKSKSINNLALEVFQYFNKISIFIDYEWFLNLKKQDLLKFNYELRDIWIQNLTIEQRKIISVEILNKTNDELNSKNLEEIQKYLLNQIKNLLCCEIEEFKYMINYIIVGALGIVIPEIKELYPDFSFAFLN